MRNVRFFRHFPCIFHLYDGETVHRYPILYCLFSLFSTCFRTKMLFCTKEKKALWRMKRLPFRTITRENVKVICHLFHFDLSFSSNGKVHFAPYSIGIWIESDRSSFNCCHPTNTNEINVTKTKMKLHTKKGKRGSEREKAAQINCAFAKGIYMAFCLKAWIRCFSLRIKNERN